MDNTIEELIDKISVQDYANAKPMFAELMASKLHDAIDAEKISVASKMFSPDDEEDLEIDLEDEDFVDEEEDFTDEE